MDRLEKNKSLNVRRADAERDIELINKYAVKELTPEEVYCFTARLCDNNVDRDTERFTDRALDKLAPMFLGKTGLFDHYRSAEKMVARVYRTQVAETGGQTDLGDRERALFASAYILRTDANKSLIEAIEGGIVKEISVGFSAGPCTCSICGERQKINWSTWRYQCENGHIKGDSYDGKLCVGEINDPREAYEFSFVAVPAQREAGIIKSAGDPEVERAILTLAHADLSGCVEGIKALIPKLQAAFEDAAERAERAKILSENEKYLKKA